MLIEHGGAHTERFQPGDGPAIAADGPPTTPRGLSTPGGAEEELVLHLRTGEVALLLDIFEAALPTERISGLHTHNPALSHFFNSVYGGLISTAREQGWGAASLPSAHR